MENNTKNGFMNIQLFGESNDAATSQNDTNANNEGNLASTPDYEQKSKELQLEVDRLRNSISKLNSECAEHKRKEAEYKQKELDKMTDEQKKAKEQEELLNRLNQLEAENKSMKLKDELLSEGFSTDEAKQLIEAEFSVSSIAKIVKARVEEATKTAKATMIKNTPSDPMGKGTTEGEQQKSAFQIYQESKIVPKSKIEFKK